MKFLSCLIVFLLFSTNSNAALITPDDEPYFSFKVDGYNYIFTEDSENFLRGLILANRKLNALYEEEFNWIIDQEVDLILASSKNQIANGFATPLPNIKTAFFNGGSLLIDNFSSKSWLHSLLTHEIVHIYQTSAKTKSLSKISQFVGHPPAVPFLSIILPNVFLPTFVLEGNAMFNENRFGNGGRLYSGEYRALFLQHLKAGKISSAHLINDHLDFPFGTEKYIVGGYFQYYLAQRFGIKRVNHFFIQNATHFINPFLLNSTFKETFGHGYEELISDFISFYKSDADKIIELNGNPQAKTLFYSPINSNKEKIFFVTNESGRDRNTLNVIDKDTGNWERSQTHLGLGKIFLDNHQFYYRGSAFVSPDKIEIGLYDEKAIRNPKYQGKAVYYLDSENELFSFPEKSFKEPILLRNDQVIGPVHSEPLIGEDGELYTIKQEGSIRAIYRGNDELFRWKGFYGKLVHADSSEVFFIANSKIGSSLYSIKDGKTFRWSSSDVIIDARKLKEGWLTVEVSSESYTYQIHNSLVPQEEQPESPVYFFERDPIYDQEISFDEIADLEAPKFFEPYSGIKNLRFNYLIPLIGYSDVLEKYYGSFYTAFSDPMAHHNITLNLTSDPNGNVDGLIQYKNGIHSAAFYGGYEYDESKTVDQVEKKVTKSYLDHSAYAGVEWSLFREGRWAFKWNLETSYEYLDLGAFDPVESFLGTTWASLNYGQSAPLAYEGLNIFGTRIGYRQYASGPKWTKNSEDLVFSFDGLYSFGDDWIVNYGFFTGSAPAGAIAIGYTPSVRENIFYVQNIFPGETLSYKEVRAFQLGLKKALPFSYYFSSFPFSVRQIAPYLITNLIDRENTSSSYFEEQESLQGNQVIETGYGMEVELLFIHKSPIRIKFGEVTLSSSATPSKSSFIFELGTGWSF